MAPGARPRAVLLVVPGGPAGLSLLDALCRTALAARRSGLDVELRTTDTRLSGLVLLTGLADALGVRSAQPEGQAEPGEDVVTEEVVDVGDPAV